MNPLCETPGCECEAMSATSEDGWRCDSCRVKDRTQRRACDFYERCVHLRKPAETWANTWGTPEGKERFINQEWRGRVRYWSRKYFEYRERTEKQARGVAAAEWRRIRRKADEHEPYELECGLGHSCSVVSRILGHEFIGGAIGTHLSVTRCGHQLICKSYVPQGPILAKLTIKKEVSVC